jgi:hypothetical protein
LVPYLGQAVPGLTPERFAPGVVSTDAIEFNSVFSPDGREFYFTRIVKGLLSRPRTLGRLDIGTC